MPAADVVLVDTSVWVDFFNGHASPEAGVLAARLEANDPIALPGIVQTEILLGLRTEADAERIAGLLGAFEAAPELTRSDYLEAARIFRTCRRAGSTLRSAIDCLIAQTCLRHGFELLAKDRDYVVIARHFPLRLQEARSRGQDPQARGPEP